MKNTFDFDFKIGEFRMKNGNPVVLTGIDALKLCIEKTIRTQLNRCSIYKGRSTALILRIWLSAKATE